MSSPSEFRVAARRLREVEAPATSGGQGVLLALYERGEPSASLLRASTLARELGVELRVVRVISDCAYLHASLPQLNLLNTERSARRKRTTHARTLEWLQRALGVDASRVLLRVLCGEFVEQVAAHAKALGSEVIVVPPRAWRLGTTVTSLARAAARPVLVAREQGETKTIFAATDLGDRSRRVLSRAAQLGRTLQAKVVSFHNLAPKAAPKAALASGASPVKAISVVRGGGDPVQAIIDEARSRRADIVVVGTHYHDERERPLGVSVATRVVERALQSVLVTPIGQPARSLSQ